MMTKALTLIGMAALSTPALSAPALSTPVLSKAAPANAVTGTPMMKAGTEARYDGWNSDGAPKPPAMWRGHGGSMWADHYRACMKNHPGYSYRNDAYMEHGRKVRCTS